MRSNKLINLVGNTPIYKWNDIYLKMEMFNPSGSIKDRPASLILDRLIRNGIINKNDTVICATSGNMGISLAYFSKYYNINLIIVMPENVSKERVTKILSLGAKLILTKSSLGLMGSINEAKRLSNINNYYYIDQFDTVFNFISHYKTLSEIIKDIPDTDYIICGIGSGGTYIGMKKMANYLKLKTKIIGYEPSNNSLITNYINNEPNLISLEKDGVPGVSSNSISNIILSNINDCDLIKLVNPIDVKNYFLECYHDGLNIGISGAGSLLIAKKIKKLEPNKKIVAIIPDGIDRYYSDINV